MERGRISRLALSLSLYRVILRHVIGDLNLCSRNSVRRQYSEQGKAEKAFVDNTYDNALFVSIAPSVSIMLRKG